MSNRSSFFIYYSLFSSAHCHTLTLAYYFPFITPPSSFIIPYLASMDNYQIAEQLSLLSKLMDIHGENSFKAKSYSSAAFAIEKLPQELSTLPESKISSIRGIGDSVSKKIVELIQTGELSTLKELLNQTPEGVLEMMSIKGLGPKKIHTIWKELHISTIQELKEACELHRIAQQKGFGDKTEQKILEAIQFQQQNKGKYMYAELESFAEALQTKLSDKYSQDQTTITGAFRRQLEVIETLEWVTTVSKKDLIHFFPKDETQVVDESEEHIQFLANGAIRLYFHLTTKESFYQKLFNTSASPTFLQATGPATVGESEEAIFTEKGLPYIPPYLREESSMLTKVHQNGVPDVLQVSDIKGLIHSHSTWSDGAYKIEEMANELIRLGFEYLVISDHSKAASYANGLNEERIKEQHQEIDALNKKLAPFKIYKSIECDILGDGSMDYSNEVLSSFDLVIASIHSNLDMDEEKAMQRLMGAITNPYVTILGHMTGRLVIRRRGYPVDHKAIIDACAANHVAIEINASPYRLDMDWRYVDYAIEKGVLLSINPDAHAVEEFDNIKYGVLVAQKGGLTKKQNLSSFSRDEFEAFLQKRKKAKQLN
ncbi:MAG TPA: helix-hairpin-helix domain-containing protein [Flavisolibacter sp.]|nr:helix-hairpin-helix domain-containing protein [Flavisolibacter sp.]